MKRFFFPLLVFVFLGVLTILNWPRILFSFSPQATVNPESMQEEYYPFVSQAIFDNHPITIPNEIASLPNPPENVLGSTSGDKRIEVDLSQQRLYAYEGDRKIYDFLISSGKWGRTPTGTFQIWTKLRATRMKGGSKELGTYYDLPNVPYTMFFYNDKVPMMAGYSTHGAYWHNNFGHPMSHGCINMKISEAALLFYWADPSLGDKSSIRATADNPGTKVIIYGTAPMT